MPNDNCTMCGSFIKEEEYRTLMYPEGHYDIDIGPFCHKCWTTKVAICEGCYHAFSKEGGQKFQGSWYCPECVEVMLEAGRKVVSKYNQ